MSLGTKIKTWANSRLMAVGRVKAVALIAMAFTFLFALTVCVGTGTVAADTGTNTTTDSVYYGLTILEWAVIVLAFIVLGLFAWLKNIYLFLGFIALVAVEMLVHFLA